MPSSASVVKCVIVMIHLNLEINWNDRLDAPTAMGCGSQRTNPAFL